MNVRLIRLRSALLSKDIIKENSNFFEEVNNELIDDDIIIAENAENPVFSVVFVESGGSEMGFTKVFDSLISPIVLLTNYKNNSYPAALEIKTYCAQHDKMAFIYSGDEKHIAETISHHARSFMAKKELDNNNLGVIGEPSDWLIASKTDDKAVKKLFNINLIHIQMDELFAEIDKKEMVNIPHHEALKKKFKDHESLDLACYIYSALKRLIKKYKLHGLTIRCFDLLGKYKHTACLALALLNEEGITAGCEGDVPTLLTMHFLRALTGHSNFQANPSRIDTNEKTVLFSHCTLPLNLTKKYELTTHFESGLGIGIKGEMPLGDITICKLALNKDKIMLHECLSLETVIKENCSLPGYCRTQVLVEMQEFEIMAFEEKNFGNHVVIAYGNFSTEFYTLLLIYDSLIKKNKGQKKAPLF